jgi:hypothetical protein
MYFRDSGLLTEGNPVVKFWGWIVRKSSTKLVNLLWRRKVSQAERGAQENRSESMVWFLMGERKGRGGSRSKYESVIVINVSRDLRQKMMEMLLEGRKGEFLGMRICVTLFVLDA